jgi:ubiquitin carboxyl-terminal hydrolase 14
MGKQPTPDPPPANHRSLCCCDGLGPFLCFVQQQDAEEALIQLMNCMAQILKKSDIGSTASSDATNTIDEYFGARLETRTVPLGTDASDASAKVTTETYRRLQCFIDAETNFLFQGIKLSLREPLELRGQLFERTSTLLTLPRYLIVQMMRFDWRKDTQKKSKKLRRVDYPMKLDIADFAHPSLKHQLTSARNLLKEEQDIKLGLPSVNKKMKTDANQTAGSAPSPSPSPPPAAAAAVNPWSESGAAMEVDSGATSSASSSSSPLTLTTPTSGNYELFGVVTHKGRTSDSGHYVR